MTLYRSRMARRAVLLVAALVVAGCGGDDESSAPATTTAAPASTITATTATPTTVAATTTTEPTATTAQVASIVAGYIPDVRKYESQLHDCFIFPEDCEPLLAPVVFDTLQLKTQTFIHEIEAMKLPTELNTLVAATLDSAKALVAEAAKKPCPLGGEDCQLLVAGFVVKGLMDNLNRWAPYL